MELTRNIALIKWLPSRGRKDKISVLPLGSCLAAQLALIFPVLAQRLSGYHREHDASAATPTLCLGQD
jgi:hypothetical protein